MDDVLASRRYDDFLRFGTCETIAQMLVIFQLGPLLNTADSIVVVNTIGLLNSLVTCFKGNASDPTGREGNFQANNTQ